MTSPSPSSAAPVDLHALPERCAALALRLCPLAFAHLVWEAPARQPRSWSIGALACPLPPLAEWDQLLGAEPLLAVADTSADSRFAGYADRHGESLVRALVRLRIILPDSLTRVSLWLLDHAPRPLAPDERVALADLAHLIAHAFAGGASAPTADSSADQMTISRLHAALRNATDLVSINDAQGVVRYISPSVTRILGYKPEEMIGQLSFTFLHPDDLAAISTSFQRSANTPGVNPSVRMRFRAASGEWRMLEATSTNLLDDPSIQGVLVNARDVTEKVRAEQEREASARALRESEERYRRLIELAPDVVMVLRGPQIGFINRTGLRLLAATAPEQVIGQPISSFIHADDLPMAQARVQALMGGTELPPTVYRIIGLDGQLRLMEVVSIPIQDAGAPAVLVIARDITERRRQEAQTRFQASVLDQMDDAVVAIDGQLRVSYLNPAAERQYGMPLAEARGILLTELFTVRYFQPDDGVAARAAMAQSGVWRGECYHVLRDGRSLMVELVVVALHGEGVAGGYVAVVRDITVRKRAEERLYLLESVVVHAHDGVVVTDPAPLEAPGPYIRYVNDAFTAMTGYTREEVLGHSPRMLQGEQTDPRTLRQIREALEAQQPIRVELCNYTKAGEPIWLDLSIAPVHGGDGQISHFIAIQRDITRRRQLEAQLLQSQKLESIGRLAGGVAHDFNNLLTAIGGYTELVQAAVSDPTIYADVEEIRKGVERATALTRHLLVFARRQPHSPRVVELNSLVTQLQNLLQRLLGPDVAMRTALTTASTTVTADPTQLDQVLINLAVNARDAMPTGGVLFIRTELLAAGDAVEVAERGGPPAKVVRLTVSDNGYGMNEEVQAHLFEPFFTTKPPGQGTGLGLATCYGIVRQHGGRIAIASRPGTGTTITIDLPHHDEPADPEATPATPGATKGQETVLVVDDETAVRALVRRGLSAAGYRVYEAPDGVAAMALLEAQPPGAFQLVLTDVLMPKMNGRQLGQWVGLNRPTTRVLYMSGHAMLAGGDAVAPLTPLIPKPFAMADLLHTVRTTLDAIGEECG